MSERVLAHPEYGLIASEAQIEKWRQEIGKKQLNTDRKATELDRLNPDLKVAGSHVSKETLTDDDIREITVAEIDERMLNLEVADQSSPAVTKAYNDLRDMKNAIIGLSRSPELSYYGTAEDAAVELDTEGRSDEAQVMLAAAQLLQETGSRPYSGSEHTPEENRAIVQAQLKAHNVRVSNNEARRT